MNYGTVSAIQCDAPSASFGVEEPVVRDGVAIGIFGAGGVERDRLAGFGMDNHRRFVWPRLIVCVDDFQDHVRAGAFAQPDGGGGDEAFDIEFVRVDQEANH
jgi:hypothetical protein